MKKIEFPANKIIAGIFSLLVVLAVLMSVVPAFAEGSGPMTVIPGLGRISNPTLTRMHQSEIGWFNDQAALFQEADQLTATFQSLIDAQDKKKHDTTVLKVALNDYENKLVSARLAQTGGASIIFSLDGFKVDGSVRDPLAAGQTVLDGRVALNDVRVRLNSAMDTLSTSFKKWRNTVRFGE